MGTIKLGYTDFMQWACTGDIDNIIQRIKMERLEDVYPRYQWEPRYIILSATLD
jgi:hypothetical protein